MTYASFITSGALSAASGIATGTSPATLFTGADVKAVAIYIQNNSTQHLEVFFNRTAAPSGAGGFDFMVLAGNTVYLDVGQMGRHISARIYGRIPAVGTGDVCISVFR